MLIDGLRLEGSLQTSPSVFTKPKYFMDVKINEEEIVAVPINAETFMNLTDLTADTPSTPETLMGVPS